MISFLSQMTALDIVFLILWVLIIIYGVYSGVIRQVLLFGSVLVGMALASAFALQTTDALNLMLHGRREDLLPFVYVFLVFFLAALVNVATHFAFPGRLISQRPLLDRLTGAAGGFLAGLLIVMELASLLSILTQSPWSIMDGARSSIRLQLDTTPFIPLLINLFPFVQSLIEKLTP